MNLLDDRNFHATLMSKDIAIAEINGRYVEPVCPELLPLQLKRNRNIEPWLSMRAIDAHRTNSRLLKKALRLSEKDDINTTLKFNAATITDTFWVKQQEETKWEDVRFKENFFALLALRGDFAAFALKPSRTPELTNIGSFEKCWRQIDGKWWMYKAGNDLEYFSELFVEQLGLQMGFPMAHYEMDGEYIRTRDFTDGAKVNFEAACGLMDDNESYLDNYLCFQEISQDLADQYLEIIILDVICLNADRHTQNYGFLRDPDTGKILRMAPNFDNNISLISRGYTDLPRRKTILNEEFEILENETRAIELYEKRHGPFKKITEEMIEEAYRLTGATANLEYLKEFLLKGYEDVFSCKRKK